MVQLLMDTGIRLSELVGLDITDVDLDGYALHVQRKSDKAGTVYFSGETKEILEAYLITREDFEPNPNEKALPLFCWKKSRISHIWAHDRTTCKRVCACCWNTKRRPNHAT